MHSRVCACLEGYRFPVINIIQVYDNSTHVDALLRLSQVAPPPCYAANAVSQSGVVFSGRPGSVFSRHG